MPRHSSIPQSDQEAKAERERLWRFARYGYLVVLLFMIAGIVFSVAAIVSLLKKL